jgi:hypothetical protein
MRSFQEQESLVPESRDVEALNEVARETSRPRPLKASLCRDRVGERLARKVLARLPLSVLLERASERFIWVPAADGCRKTKSR